MTEKALQVLLVEDAQLLPHMFRKERPGTFSVPLTGMWLIAVCGIHVPDFLYHGE
jgi:hypothetical protein